MARKFIFFSCCCCLLGPPCLIFPAGAATGHGHHARIWTQYRYSSHRGTPINAAILRVHFNSISSAAGRCKCYLSSFRTLHSEALREAPVRWQPCRAIKKQKRRELVSREAYTIVHKPHGQHKGDKTGFCTKAGSGLKRINSRQGKEMVHLSSNLIASPYSFVQSLRCKNIPRQGTVKPTFLANSAGKEWKARTREAFRIVFLGCREFVGY